MSAPYSDASTPAAASSTKKTMGILSVVFGAVSVAIGWIFVPILFLLLAVAGVILGFFSRRREPAARTLALVGIILSFVGVAVTLGSMIIGAILIASMMQSM
jgi:hypothetical protein